ncbi:MAG: sugar ABC transporter ATP-binding protein [Sphaerochaeta sp.]|nr:sugar ABC transporter ATP-binding protein [Sphaerochaeta sp.]
MDTNPKPQDMINLVGIVKEFSSVRVLSDVTFGIRSGEIMGLIGENGAGKSTLIKILCGIYQATSGEVFLEGRSASIPDYITAKHLGIGIVPQEFNLINSLTVYENIFLGNEIHKGSFLDKKTMKEMAAHQLAQLKMPVDVNRLVSELSVAEKQMVEISKAMILDARILILDEPTTTLTGHEVETLFELMRKLKAKGVTMIYISHKLQEIKAICDRVATLRDGILIGVDDVSEVDEEDLARKMVGRDFSQVFPPKLVRTTGEEMLSVENLSIEGLLHDISFSLRKGEILGFAGLVGAGRTETMEALMGLRKIDRGTIQKDGKAISIRHPKDAVRNKLGYISEDRQGKGIVQRFDIPKNISLISLRKKYLHRGFIDKAKEASEAKRYVKEFNIVAASLDNALQFFSGGNQQKVYLARWMDTNPEILILDEPTRGIDINAKSEIYEFVHHLASSGIGCILVSSEMEEIIGLCSRVYVLREGRVTGCLEGDEITEENIMFNATGIKEGI